MNGWLAVGDNDWIVILRRLDEMGQWGGGDFTQSNIPSYFPCLQVNMVQNSTALRSYKRWWKLHWLGSLSLITFLKTLKGTCSVRIAVYKNFTVLLLRTKKISSFLQICISISCIFFILQRFSSWRPEMKRFLMLPWSVAKRTGQNLCWTINLKQWPLRPQLAVLTETKVYSF